MIGAMRVDGQLVMVDRSTPQDIPALLAYLQCALREATSTAEEIPKVNNNGFSHSSLHNVR